MTKKKKKVAPKKAAPKKARAVKVLKITPVEPDKHVVELEIQDAPLPLPLTVPAVNVMEPSFTHGHQSVEPQAPEQNALLKWLKSLW